jgi:hypothetical protein
VAEVRCELFLKSSLGLRSKVQTCALHHQRGGGGTPPDIRGAQYEHAVSLGSFSVIAKCNSASHGTYAAEITAQSDDFSCVINPLSSMFQKNVTDIRLTVALISH